MGLAPAFFAQAAAVVATPWTLAANQDLAYPQTRGERPADLEQQAVYFAAVDALAADDADLQRLIVEVFNLTQPLSVLTEEPLVSRALARNECDGPTRTRAVL
jgi:hypothetical protein